MSRELTLPRCIHKIWKAWNQHMSHDYNSTCDLEMKNRVVGASVGSQRRVICRAESQCRGCNSTSSLVSMFGALVMKNRVVGASVGLNGGLGASAMFYGGLGASVGHVTIILLPV